MSVQVRIPTLLRPSVGGASSVTAEGSTVGEVVASLVRAHPAIAAVLLEGDGALKRFINVFVGDEDVRYLQGMETPVPEGAEVVILPAAAGG